MLMQRKSATTMDSTSLSITMWIKKVYTLPEVVLDGPYVLFHDDDVVISVVELVVVIVGFRLLLGTPSTLINNVKLPVWPLLPIA